MNLLVFFIHIHNQNPIPMKHTYGTTHNKQAEASTCRQRLVSIFPLLLAAFFAIATTQVQAQDFVHEDGPLNDTSSWTPEPDNFTGDGQTFTIQDEAYADDDWTLAGEGTRLIIDTDEEITFEAGTQVTFDGITVEFTDEGRADLILNGDIHIIGGVSWEGDRGDFWSIEMEEDGDQTITTDQHSKLMAYNFDAEKSEGTLDLVSSDEASIVFEAFNNLDLDFSGDALFRDNGNTFVVGDDIEMDGDADSYELTGILEHRVTDGNSDYEIVVPELHHLYVWVREDGNPRFRDEQGEDGDDDFTQEITIGGNFIIDMDSDGDFEFNDVHLHIGGDFDIRHHRQLDTEEDAELDIDEAVIHVDGDFIAKLTRAEDDGDENISMGDGELTIGGNMYIYTNYDGEDNGEFDFDDSTVTVAGDVFIYMYEGGVVDLDDSVVDIGGDFIIDIDSAGDFEFGDGTLTIGNNLEITHNRPEGADGDGEIDGDEITLHVGNDFILTLTKFEADGDENISLDEADITIDGNFYVFAHDNGEFDMDDAHITLTGGYAKLEASNGGIFDLDEGSLFIEGDLVITLEDGSEFDFDDSHIELNGDLVITVDESSELDLDDSHIEITGDFIVDAEPGATLDAGDVAVLFHGGQPQNLESNNEDLQVDVLIIDKTENNLHLNGPLQVNTELELVSGLIEVHEEAVLYLSAGATVEGADDTSYVSGLVSIEVADDAEHDLFYPIGKDGLYGPVHLSLTQEEADSTWYALEMFAAAPPDLDMPDDIKAILDEYHYALSIDGEGILSDAIIAIPFDILDASVDENLLEIVKSDNGAWINLGGSVANGHVQSAVNFTEGGYFALAEELQGTTKAITAFDFEELDPPVIGDINEAEKTITLEVPYGTDTGALVPTITHTGESISPESGVAQDFSEPVDYTVTAEDSSTAVYTATLIVLPSMEPSQLTITHLNEGNTVFADTDFSLGVGIMNEVGDIVEATSDIAVSLSLESGSGSLSGNLTGTIPEGETEVSIEGIIYDTAESDVSITASADELEPATTAHFEVEEIVAEHELVHFWYFGDYLENNTPFETIDPTFNQVEGALISYHSALAGYPFDPDHENWRKASLERRNRPTDINYRPQGNDWEPYDEDDMRGVQVRQPFTGDNGENTVFLHLPTTGYQDAIVSFAAKDNGDNEDLMAAVELIIDYAVEADGDWITDGLDETVLPLLFEEYQLYEIDFTGIEAVNDNPDFVVRIRFDGPNMDLDDGDRVVFNNIAMDGMTTIPPEFYDVTFVVEDVDGQEINDAVITLGDITNEMGDYTFHDVAEGSYSYHVTALGYTDASGVITVDGADVTEVVVLMEEHVVPDDLELVQFWFFGDDMPNNTPLEYIEPTFDMVGGALITYQSALAGYPFNEDHPYWRKASLERRNRPTDMNYRPEGNDNIPYGDTDMRAIQVRQPFTGDAGENTLYLHLPTSGYRDPVVSFAAKDNGDNEDLMAAEYLLIDYAIEQGGDWITTGLEATSLPLQFEEYRLFVIDFREIPEADNNPHFTMRIRFDGPNLTLDDGDRVVFNNIALDADPMDDTWVQDNERLHEVIVSPNPARDAFRIEVDQPGMDIRIYNLNGSLMSQKRMDGKVLSMDASRLQPGMYIIRATDPDTMQSVISRLIIQ